MESRQATSDASTINKLDGINASLNNVQGAVKSLACDVDQNARADEAWTIHEALENIQQHVSDLRDELDE